MKHRFCVAVIGLSLLVPSVASAHGPEELPYGPRKFAEPARPAGPAHGGIMQMANGMSFELVGGPDSAALYVAEDGEPVPPAGFKGKLSVTNGAEKSEVDLAVAGDKLVAKGVKLVSGSKVVAMLVTPGAKWIQLRFAVQ